MAVNGIIKVTPEKLLETANEFSTSGKTISSLTNEMMSIVNSLKSVWQGSAASGYSSKFNSLQDDITKINRIIEEHVADLTEMARTYQAAEDRNLEESERLLSEVIN